MKKSIAAILIVVFYSFCKKADFDLSGVIFTNKIEQVITTAGLVLESGNSKAWTLAGYKIFESSDPKLLKFNGADLTGKSGDSVNKVLIHYAIADHTVKLIEIKVFSKLQIKALEDALDRKLGKAIYPNDAYTTVFSKYVNFYERTWIDPKTTTGYFYTDAVNKAGKEEGRLAIVNYSDKMMSELTRLKGYTSSVDSNVKLLTDMMVKQVEK